MGVTVRSSELERAAEQTIAAAAAALLWAGEDSQGVLAHVAVADPQLMVGTRMVYERLAAGRTTHDIIANLREEYRTTTTLFEVAALPWLVAPEWASQVIRALPARRQGPYDPGSSAAQSIMDNAIHACRQWGEDPLDINRIMYWASDTTCADRCWRYQNAKR
ncbi:hypothetical protein K7Z54_23455 [Mycobacterium avium subsp. hominissuis]|uniref:hypothetical protein n=1 Tax=Mycobacterium avium TaxID=1764 RepID=UPI00293B62DA|nr:hypothetical protein [Mycobacterium avium]MDV3249562.1 hypothetical protein [Mycobacterium avium subsp. hominissuis]MDV3276623.1 hypothetical protein [Mycobacterium avium subsp. hominissuis]MDV3324195.1 hypothetical protein [Mycobacterium avium subsp. hominissuis]